MHLIIQFADDDVEVTYEVEGVSICHDTFGLTGLMPGLNRRPEGDYLIVKGARLTDIQGRETGRWAQPR